MTFDNWNGHSHCTTKLSPTSPQLLIFWKISKFIRFGRASYTICSKTSRWNKQEMQKNCLMTAMPFDDVWMLQCPQPMYESVPTSRDVFFHKLVSSSSNQIEVLLWVFDALYLFIPTVFVQNRNLRRIPSLLFWFPQDYWDDEEYRTDLNGNTIWFFRRSQYLV